MRAASLWCAVAAFVGWACAAPARRAPPLEPPAAKQPGPAQLLCDPFALWPLVEPGIESRYQSSFDRGGGNQDGFDGRYATLYRRADGSHVIFDALGPGVLHTLWFTGPEEGGAGLDLGALRFFFDDEPQPRISSDVRRLFGGAQPPFVRPLVADNRTSTGGFASWVPLPFARRLVITSAKKPSFFIAQYDVHPVDAAIASWRPGDRCDAARALFLRALARRWPRTGLRELPLHHAEQGAGTIDAVVFSPRGRPTAEQLGRARVRIRFDDATRPQVDVPLDMFFGSGLGEADVRAVAFSMQRGRYENRLPMPFWQRFAISVDGLAGTLRLAVGPPRFAPGTAGHLWARYSEAVPTVAGQDFEWLNVVGAGKLVGTVLAVRPLHPENKKWWEGDLRSYADERRTPGLHGTGHEDDHLGGWSNTFFGRPFSLPMHGEPATRIIERSGVQHNAETTMYRLWPGIRFLRALRHSVEHGSENEIPARYYGAAFYYALPGGPLLVQTDHVDLEDAAARSAHALRLDGPLTMTELGSAFEGRAYDQPYKDTAFAHRGELRVRFALRPDNRGCALRRLYDQQLPRQRATVLVDGARVGDWYVAEGNTILRWAERDFFLPPRFTAGKQQIELALRPQPGAPPWNAAEYRVLCVAPAAAR